MQAERICSLMQGIELEVRVPHASVVFKFSLQYLATILVLGRWAICFTPYLLHILPRVVPMQILDDCSHFQVPIGAPSQTHFRSKITF